MTDAEFTERFVAHLLAISGGGEFEDGTPIEEYAREACPAYLADEIYRSEGPEACAEGDYQCWEFS